MIKTIKLIAAAIVLTGLVSSCSNEPKSDNSKETSVESHEHSEDYEHTHDAGDGGEGGEEDGTQFGKSDIYDVVKKGTHLVLSFDEENNAFIGTVENTTNKMIENVRVEVHLSNGIELGPTKPVDLEAGAETEVKLEASEKAFETWSTHAEVGNSEHSHEGGEGEHSYEGHSHEEGDEH